MRHHTPAAAACLLAAALLTAGCSSSSSPAGSAQPTATGTAACRAAIKDQYVPGTAQLKGEPTRPPACAGLSNDAVSEIVTSVIDENTKG